MITHTYEQMRRDLVHSLLASFVALDPETMLCESIVLKTTQFLAESSVPVRGARRQHVATLLRSALDSFSETAIASGRYDELRAELNLAIEHFDVESGAAESSTDSSKLDRDTVSESIRVGSGVASKPVD